MKAETINKSIKANRFIKIKLESDDLKLIELADANEKSFFNL